MNMESGINKSKYLNWKPSIGLTIIIFLISLWWGVPTFLKWRADAQVRELCAIDGGVKVYEVITLPPEKFNQWGQINFYRPVDDENALGQEYTFLRETNYLERGHLNVLKLVTKIIRRADSKLLGESKIYIRRGGDPLGPWHDSSYTCPELNKDTDILRRVFEMKKESRDD